MKRLSVLLLSLLCACTTTKHVSSRDALYSNEQEWKVKIRDGWLSAKTIAFGPYTTSSRKNGVTDAMAVSFIKDPKNPFSFYTTGNDERILVQTMNTNLVAFSSRPLPTLFNGISQDTPIYYTLINGSGNDPLKRWEMVLRTSSYMELNDNKPAGILRSPTTDIRITAHNRFGKVNSYEKICYEFQYRGQPVAAVMPGENPRVWVSKDTDAATAKTLAAAIAALLLK
ncbi:hypothetical protein [Chitinophaga sp. MM2321]|uniref:hypothetical protein n=1 Tax=Chitinophaga sp. MM2321 TaxID=3137178 RepID=UPI0032D5ADC0